MFQEMGFADQEEKIAAFNAEKDSEVAAIPAQPTERQNRHMIPFYVWLAKTTWGDATPEEIIEFTMKIKK